MSNGLPCTAGDGQDAIIMITDLVNGGNITLCADHLVGYCVDVVNALPDPEPVHAEPQAATTPGGDTDTVMVDVPLPGDLPGEDTDTNRHNSATYSPAVLDSTFDE